MQSYEQTAAYVHALTGEPVETVALWWRCIHDTDKTVPAHKYYGTLSQVWETLCTYNNSGWGIFCNINAFLPPADGIPLHENKHELQNVWFIRTHVVDLDNALTAQQNYQLAAASNPAPCFAVGTSGGKFHVYWPSPPYQGNERYNAVQRKLRQLYDGDRSIVDPTRVLRVPGFYNHKYSTPGTEKYNGSAPHLVSCWSLPGYLQRQPVETMEAALQHINVIDSGAGGRHALGDEKLAAPSLDWLRYALNMIDPNNLDRGEWISTSAAFKQAGWTHATDDELFNIWSEWCARYGANDAGENHKQWYSIRETEVGWKSFYRRVPTLNAYEKFGFAGNAPQPMVIPAVQPVTPAETPEPQFPDILSDLECKEWFRNCFFVERIGQMLTPRGRFMNATQFNGAYGGKLFVITPDGKTTDEPWKAALRSTLWTIPKVDHVRFLPDQPSFSIVADQMGRKGVNTYIPARISSRPGDVAPFLQHMELMFPVESDRRIIYEFLAHNAKFPGFKIPWTIVLQGAEGIGKTFIQEVIIASVGEMYTYSPKAEELVSSGSKFNSWLRGKLTIIVNEIKVDERRELIEILKPMITDKRVEIQSKGVDQDIEDNPANWAMFTNWKDAIPVNKNGRRYSIFYSAIQSVDDLLARGMDDAYFTALFNWLRSGGSEFVTHWLLNYPIERGAIPMRAPETSSHAEAVRISRGPYEVAIAQAVEDGLPGFRGGYISTLAVANRLRVLGGRQPTQRTVETILEGMGYVQAGRAARQFGAESMTDKTTVFTLLPGMDVSAFGKIQGYE